MEEEMLALKRAVLELEKYNSISDEGKVIDAIDNIINICQNLKSSFHKECETSYKNINCVKINTISFIYKPLLVKDYFEGDYIVKFASERSKDLKKAIALDDHNQFWIQHKTIKGNVFGSVPKELLKEDAIKSLLVSGWKEAEVDILDIKDKINDIKEIISFCENTFKNYILIEEELTRTHLILNYKIHR